MKKLLIFCALFSYCFSSKALDTEHYLFARHLSTYGIYSDEKADNMDKGFSSDLGLGYSFVIKENTIQIEINPELIFSAEHLRGGCSVGAKYRLPF